MNLFIKLTQFFAVAALATGTVLPASAQFPGAQEQPDQVDQLAQLLGLSDEQQTDIRAVIDDLSPKIDELQSELQGLHEELQEQSGPDFDEAEIRKTADKIGELTGEMTALSVILQSKVESEFTEEQRETLKNLEQQQQQPPQQQQQRPQGQAPQQPGGGEADQHGRNPGDPHYGHDHP